MGQAGTTRTKISRQRIFLLVRPSSSSSFSRFSGSQVPDAYSSTPCSVSDYFQLDIRQYIGTLGRAKRSCASLAARGDCGLLKKAENQLGDEQPTLSLRSPSFRRIQLQVHKVARELFFNGRLAEPPES